MTHLIKMRKSYKLPDNTTTGKINTKLGAMEVKATVQDVLEGLLRCVKQGGKLTVSVIENSKNHNGKTMLLLTEDPGDDVSIYHLELSEEGIFPYIVDDGVS